MSVEDYTEEAGSEPAAGTDFETDAKRVAAIMLQAIDQGQDAHEQFRENSLSQAQVLTDWFDQRDVPPEQAIAAAWFFILSFD